MLATKPEIKVAFVSSLLIIAYWEDQNGNFVEIVENIQKDWKDEKQRNIFIVKLEK